MKLDCSRGCSERDAKGSIKKVCKTIFKGMKVNNTGQKASKKGKNGREKTRKQDRKDRIETEKHKKNEMNISKNEKRKAW